MLLVLLLFPYTFRFTLFPRLGFSFSTFVLVSLLLFFYFFGLQLRVPLLFILFFGVFFLRFGCSVFLFFTPFPVCLFFPVSQEVDG